MDKQHFDQLVKGVREGRANKRLRLRTKTRSSTSSVLDQHNGYSAPKCLSISMKPS